MSTHSYTADTKISFFMAWPDGPGRRKEGPLGEMVGLSAAEIQTMSEKDIKTLLAAVFREWVHHWSERTFGEIRKVFRQSPTGRNKPEDSEVILRDSFELTAQLAPPPGHQMSKMNLNHQKVRVPGLPLLCRLCGAHFDETIQGVCPSRVVRFAAPNLLDEVVGAHGGSEREWVRLDGLHPGAIFETRDGIQAVKSEYRYDSGACQCVLLGSGEYAHFPEKDATQVREIVL